MQRLLTVLFLFLTACSGIPDGLQAVDNFNLQRYLGTWYEIVRLDHRFERGLDQVTATYSLRQDGGVKVLNRGFNSNKQRWQEAEGKAYFMEQDHIGRLKVSFFGPFYASYNILRLDPEYQYVMICGNSRDYFWILSRTPELPEATLNALLDEARQMGFAVDELIRVKH